LKDGNRIQIDLRDILKVDKIVVDKTELKNTRKADSVFIDFPQTLKNGEIYAIDFYYSGTPTPIGRFGSLAFNKDPQGRPYIYTACEEEGPSMWWPCKDQWQDKVESADISVSVPNALTDVSNGRFVAKTDLGDGYTRWDWHVSYPINAYCISMNIATYVHFDDKFPANEKLGTAEVPMDFWVWPEDLDKAKVTFQQARKMIEAYTHYFGEYPFIKDGYKLVEAQLPNTGMEHQSAVTYGNGFRNGYNGRGDQRFDFIIIHESGHEWFANSISAGDRSDMWIHEGFTNYLESLFVEYWYGKEEGIKYVNNQRPQNRQPVISERGVYSTPPGDQYGKGARFLNTIRGVVNDDDKYFKLLRDFYQKHQHSVIMTEDINKFFNEQTGMNLTPIFKQYLWHAAIPVLELKFDDAKGTVDYRWKADEKDFAMPIRVGKPDAWQVITPTLEWQTMKTSQKKDDFAVATDFYYVNVARE
ncbi:MAG TPA: M1 family metallopeptidase, partial [Phycisphaerae bacterium]|nr:M1 family metallopeptidase [Phycisphaerae bacterium]